MRAGKSEKQKAFEGEALEHAELLYNYALRMTGNTADADDLVQETYLKAYRFWDRYEQGTNIRAWLFRILKNSYINRYRKESKEPGMVDYDEIQNVYSSIGSGVVRDDTPDASFDRMLDDVVSSAVLELPEDFRTVVILCDIEGLTYEEIAEFVDRPLGTVRSRLHRGRKLLQHKLSSYAREHGYLASPVRS